MCVTSIMKERFKFIWEVKSEKKIQCKCYQITLQFIKTNKLKNLRKVFYYCVFVTNKYETISFVGGKQIFLINVLIRSGREKQSLRVLIASQELALFNSNYKCTIV